MKRKLKMRLPEYPIRIITPVEAWKSLKPEFTAMDDLQALMRFLMHCAEEANLVLRRRQRR